MKSRWLLLGLALVVLLAFAIYLSSIAYPSQKSGHMYLLAVSEGRNNSFEGSIADLYAEIRPGTGRIFIDTFPITKLDTQLSARFAKEMACSFAETDCRGLDFFYTIRSQASTIGGPSAGAAITLLTISLLKDIPINDSTLITGTINSGGVIGPVGGLKEKIDVAATKNITKLLVARGSSLIGPDNESHADIFKYGREQNVPIVKVGDVRGAFYELTGVWYPPPSAEFAVNDSYQTIMRGIAIDLCNRSETLMTAVDSENSTSYYLGLNLSLLGSEEFANERYYAAASRCFGANIHLKQAWYELQNYSVPALRSEVESIKIFQNRIEAILVDIKLRTVTDLQTFIIVDERLLESERYLDRAVSAIDNNNTKDSLYFMAYAFERLNSARSWSKFFGSPGKEFDLDRTVLEGSCIRKLSEAEERIQYVRSFFPLRMEETQSELDSAYTDYTNEDFELCLFRASKAKAELDVIVSVMGVRDESVDDLLTQKLDIARNAIVEETLRGNFPILGYSYYEYASRLASQDKYSALIYTEYAIELSNLELYLNPIGAANGRFMLNPRLLSLFISGLLFGIIVGSMLFYNTGRKKRKLGR